MNIKYISVLLFISLLFIGQASAYIEIPNNMATFEDADIKIQSTNVTQGSGYIDFEITYKRLPTNPANIDLGFGVNTSEIRFTDAEYWSPYYNDTQNWISIPNSRITKYNIDYDNKNLWYFLNKVPVYRNETNKMRIKIELPHKIGAQSYKYDIVTKLSSDTFAAAKTAGRLKLLDPYGDSTNFNSTWNTSKTSAGSSNSTEIKLPLELAGTYNFTVWWGDGSSDVITAWDQANVTHNYSVAGVYNLVIDGTLYGFRFNNVGDRLKLIDITQWGNMRVGNSGGYFYGASNFNSTAADYLDTTGTTNMYAMFNSATAFNQNISAWNTASVTSMVSMFQSAYAFNQSIGNWNVSKVTNMVAMFSSATAFNQNIGSWNVSKVTSMASMFYSATTFNQNISAWNTSLVTSMASMFYSATVFNQNLGSWNVSKVTTMANMFLNLNLTTSNYDGILNGWASLPSVNISVPFHAGVSQYSYRALTARNTTLIGVYGWTITDGGQNSEVPPSDGLPNITSWGNNYTNNNTLSFTIPQNTNVTFNATANQTLTTCSWTGAAEINCSTNTFAYKLFDTAGTQYVNLSGSNANGSTLNSVNWTIVILGTTPNITSWTPSLLNQYIELFSTQLFSAVANQIIDTWNWFLNGTNQSNNYDNLSYNFNMTGYYILEVNATNTNGSSNTIQWNNTIKQAPEVNVSVVIT